MSEQREVWASGEMYEFYVGRWSRPLARHFLAWFNGPSDGRWLDVGCGTGALSEAILAVTSPRAVTAVDLSEAYLSHAAQRINDARLQFQQADAARLPHEENSFDAAVSGLCLNFVPQPEQVVAEMKRVVRPGGTVGLYVWDYAGKMEFMRYFWDAVAALAPEDAGHDEGRRFPICQPEPLAQLFQMAGLEKIQTTAIDIPTHFQDFDDYWTPFLGGQGPAPGYVVALDEERRAALQERLRATLPIADDGTIPLIARAWAVQGISPR